VYPSRFQEPPSLSGRLQQQKITVHLYASTGKAGPDGDGSKRGRWAGGQEMACKCAAAAAAGSLNMGSGLLPLFPSPPSRPIVVYSIHSLVSDGRLAVDIETSTRHGIKGWTDKENKHGHGGGEMDPCLP